MSARNTTLTFLGGTGTVTGSKYLLHGARTHAHVDHSGYLPRFIKHGYAGNVYCSHGTRDLCEILLPDAGHLQEEARYANQRGFSKHSPALPLYTEVDARESLRRFAPVAFGATFTAGEFQGALLPVGHILGASVVTLRAGGGARLLRRPRRVHL